MYFNALTSNKTALLQKGSTEISQKFSTCPFLKENCIQNFSMLGVDSKTKIYLPYLREKYLSNSISKIPSLEKAVMEWRKKSTINLDSANKNVETEWGVLFSFWGRSLNSWDLMLSSSILFLWLFINTNIVKLCLSRWLRIHWQ